MILESDFPTPNVGGVCGVCGKEIKVFFAVMWCDDCLNEKEAMGLTMSKFMAQKKENAK